VDLVREKQDPGAAAKQLVDHALNRFSTDNLSCMIVRFIKEALIENQQSKDIGVEGDQSIGGGKVSEAEKIVRDTKQSIAEGATPAVGVSASNSGRGHDLAAVDKATFKPTALDGSVEEEPSSLDETNGSPGAPPPGSVTSMDTEASKKKGT
jgi:protein phosphatase PTC1